MENLLGQEQLPQNEKYAKVVNGILNDVHDFIRSVSASHPLHVIRPGITATDKSVELFLHSGKDMIGVELNPYGDEILFELFQPLRFAEVPRLESDAYRQIGPLYAISTETNTASHFESANPLAQADFSYEEVLELRNDLRDNLLINTNLPRIPFARDSQQKSLLIQNPEYFRVPGAEPRFKNKF